MQRCYDRHAKLSEKSQKMAAGRAAENSVFMLHADNINLADVEKLRGHPVIGKFVLIDLKSHSFRIWISLGFVIHGKRPAVYVGRFCQ